MRILDKYVLREMIAPFLVSVFAFVWLFVGDILFQFVRVISERQIPFLLVLKLLALHVPWSLGYALPLATLFGTSLCVNRLTRDSEITAIRMSGTPVLRILLPILFTGLAVSAVTFWLGESVTPKTTTEIRRTMGYIAGLETLPTIQANVFFQSEGYCFYIRNVDRANPKEIKLRKVMIYDYAHANGFPMLITASWATSKNNRWTLHDGVTYNLGADGLTQWEAKFSVMDLNLRQAMVDLWNSQKTTEEMNSRELRQQIDMLGGVGKEVTKMNVDWQFKLSIPLACFIFALCAAPLSLRFARYGGYAGLFLGILIMFLYQIMRVWGELLGLNGVVPPFIAGWSQNILFALLGLYLIWREE